MYRVIAAALALCLAGCVSSDDGREPMCETTDDCDPGEVCDIGICFGNPPPQSLSAELHPPADRPDLARTQLASLAVAPDGTIMNASFGPSVQVTGRVTLSGTPGQALAARLVFRRASRIPGGPDLLVATDAIPGQGSADFSVRLAPNDPDDPADLYEVTIIPDDGSLTYPTSLEPTAAELAPPRRQLIAFTDDTEIELTVGDPDGLKRVQGRVVDAVGNGVANMLVRAWGRYREGGELEVASTLARTASDGSFTLALPVSWQDTFDLHATPPAGARRPTIERRGVVVPDPARDDADAVLVLPSLALPSFAQPVRMVLPVVATSGSGGREPVVGALVTFTTLLHEAGLERVVYRASGVVDANGQVHVDLVPAGAAGNRSYLVDVVPLPDSPHATLWDVDVEVGPQGGVLAAIMLDRRVLVTGTLVDSDGHPAEGVTVRATPTFAFRNTLDEGSQDRLASLTWPAGVTEKDGLFGIYLDASAMGQPLSYDLELVPPSQSLLPQWSLDDLLVTPGDAPAGVDESSMSLDRVSLPPASYARGVIRDADGHPVPGAELRLYVVGADTECPAETAPIQGGSTPRTVRASPGRTDPCTAPARLRGLARSSEEDGSFVLVLPAP